MAACVLICPSEVTWRVPYQCSEEIKGEMSYFFVFRILLYQIYDYISSLGCSMRTVDSIDISEPPVFNTA